MSGLPGPHGGKRSSSLPFHFALRYCSRLPVGFGRGLLNWLLPHVFFPKGRSGSSPIWPGTHRWMLGPWESCFLLQGAPTGASHIRLGSVSLPDGKKKKKKVLEGEARQTWATERTRRAYWKLGTLATISASCPTTTAIGYAVSLIAVFPPPSLSFTS
ncbi:uncharacterized protein LY79DRAFT_7424 [Colletotrichum navitas]|uniref:Uncharacterized protein n=1 Tax=Colletotrichum navitas TaxID=681940 RepID=A0AAD8QFB6_9PEZI|nr:uncharacterized protein LY79DRAFT_7424 [Colletotrichum navitas]KAK1600104.1 hypothetical protein LY79DRAFT_7424 [Colletotrichum navitas]